MLIPCPHCHRGNEVASEHHGLTLLCGHCAGQFIVPTVQQPSNQTLAAMQTNIEVSVIDQRPADGGVLGGFKCRHCKARVMPVWRNRVSSVGWLTFGVLLICCPPICFLGLAIQERYRECPVCGK